MPETVGIELRMFIAGARGLQTSGDIDRRGARQIVIILEDAAKPDRRGHVAHRNADALAGEAGGLGGSLRRVDEYVREPEMPRRKYRHRHVWPVRPVQRPEIGSQREFAAVERMFG